MVHEIFQLFKAEGAADADCLGGIAAPEHTVRVATQLL